MTQQTYLCPVSSLVKILCLFSEKVRVISSGGLVFGVHVLTRFLQLPKERIVFLVVPRLRRQAGNVLADWTLVGVAPHTALNSTVEEHSEHTGQTLTA